MMVKNNVYYYCMMLCCGGGGGVILMKFVREKEKSLRRPSVRQSTASPATPRHTARIRSI